MRKTKYAIILAVFQLVCLLSVPTCVFAVPTGRDKTAAEPNLVSAPVAAEAAPIIKQLCSNICKGDFAAARALLGGSTKSKSTAITQLINIISEYEAIEQRRQSAREAAYKEQLAELKKFRVGADTSDVNDVNDISDVNDVNDITAMLAVIAKASEFANQKQKDELLSEPFVKLTFQKAIDKAAEFEVKGKWLDAYISCYSWLQAIDRGNEAYSDYADQLVTKANIVAAFQDSPCESREERFQGVKKEMFIRAVNALQFNYISSIDYRQMATKAIRRCELLAEVLNRRPALVARDPNESLITGDERRVAAWSTVLAAILDEVDQLAIGVSKDKFIDVFEKVLELNKTALELPGPVLIAQFAEAALSSLDPYTVMVWPRQIQDFEKTMTNEFTGIGVEISRQKGLLTVASLLLDTPAFNSGLLDAGDVIEKVDGEPTKDMSLMCAVRRITGPAGTKVILTIRRAGEEQPRDVTITRARITVPTIRGWQRTERGRWLYMIDEQNKIGFVRLTSFSAETASDFEKVLSELEAEGLKGLILDLRFDSGGLLDSATEVTDKFIREGLIVSTRPNPRVGVWAYTWAHEEKTHPDYPLVVLINRYSASGSEIVAGALADQTHNRATLVGERTHGKGSVQGITPYPGGGAQLKYTMAYYHLPSGQRVESKDAMKRQGREDWGIEPDIEIKLRSDELKKMIDVQRNNDVLVRAGTPFCDKLQNGSPANHNKVADSNSVEGTEKEIYRQKKHTLEETLAADPQLAVGLLVVKSKLIEEEARSVKREAAAL